MGNSFRDLVVWQKAIATVTRIYRLTETFPKHEVYGLAQQLRRAAVSVPSNIAEGQGRNSAKEFHHFLGNAKGSLAEVETQIQIAENLGYVSSQDAKGLSEDLSEIARLLNGLMKSIREKSAAAG